MVGATDAAASPGGGDVRSRDVHRAHRGGRDGGYVWIDPDVPAADGRFVAVRETLRHELLPEATPAP